MADACVSEGPARLMCIVLPALTVTPISPRLQNGECVGALSVHGQTPFYGQVNSLCEPCGVLGRHHISSGTDSFYILLLRAFTHTEMISLMRMYDSSSMTVEA